MDSFRPYDASNPMSEQFRREALRNVSQNIAALRSQKDLKEKSTTDYDELSDKVSLTQNEKSKEATPPAPRATDTPSAADTAELASQAAHGAGLLDDKDPEVRRKRREESKRLARQGVPEEILEAAKHIVDGQVHPVKGPRANLKDLKTSPETSAMETEREDFADAIDIHQEGNRPMPLEESEGLPGS